MSNDFKRPVYVPLEPYEVDCTTEMKCVNEDYDYDPPMPYNYREQWAENPVEWSLCYVAKLLRKFACGPVFYKNIDAPTIETWMFDDYPELLETLRNDKMLDTFRSSLVRQCRMHKAAAVLANEIITNRRGVYYSSPFNSSDAAECDEFYPGWLARIWTEAEWRWQAELPGAELRGKWVNEEFGNWHQSDEPHSRIVRAERVTTTPERRQSVTAHLLERNAFSTSIQAETNERFAFFIRLPADVNLETLTKCNRTRLAVHRNDTEGTCVWDLALGAGVLSIPLLDNMAVLNRFRARLPVIYERDGERSIVEYDWNPVAFGREYFELAKNNARDGRATVDALSGSVVELSSEAMRIERICPMSMAEFLDVTGAENQVDDDYVPF